MELDHLHTFFIVSKELGFSRAAKRLRVQQPTVSKCIQKLEGDLGVRLFERNKRSVRLTSDGAEIFAICQDLFENVERIGRYLEGREKTLQGDLRLGASDSLVTHVIPGVLKELLSQHPLVRPSIFSASSTAISEELLRGELELGLFFTHPHSKQFDVEEIAIVPFVLVGSPSFRGRKNPVRQIIASRENEYRGEHSFPVREMLAKRGLSPDVIVSTNNLEAQKKMIQLGMGVGLLPALMVKDEVSSGRLIRISPKSDYSYSLKRVIKRGRVLSRAAEVFLAMLKDDLA